MNITTIELPIYDLELVVLINSWEEANKKFKLGFKETDYSACAWTIYGEKCQSDSEIYLLLKDGYLDDKTILHELYHIISGICELRCIKPDPVNDEPLAYLQGYIGQKLFEFRDKYIEKSLEVKKN